MLRWTMGHGIGYRIAFPIFIKKVIFLSEMEISSTIIVESPENIYGCNPVVAVVSPRGIEDTLTKYLVSDTRYVAPTYGFSTTTEKVENNPHVFYLRLLMCLSRT